MTFPGVTKTVMPNVIISHVHAAERTRGMVAAQSDFSWATLVCTSAEALGETRLITTGV